MTSRRPYWCPKTMKRRPCWCPKPVLWELNSFLMQTLSFVPINLHTCWPREWRHSIKCFQTTSRRPYWCPKTMKRRPCWCPKPVPWELNSFLMQTLSFVTIDLHICWPREWKHSIANSFKFQLYFIQTPEFVWLNSNDFRSLIFPFGLLFLYKLYIKQGKNTVLFSKKESSNYLKILSNSESRSSESVLPREDKGNREGIPHTHPIP